MYEKMTMREWSTNTTPTSTTAPGLLSLAEPINNGDSVVSLIVFFDKMSHLMYQIHSCMRHVHT